MPGCRRSGTAFGALCATLLSAAAAAEPPLARPAIGILIDDLGDQLEAGREAVALPGPVAYAELPGTPHAETLARLAHASDKEVLLHLPMDAASGKALGPGAVTLEMGEAEFTRAVERDLESVPHSGGVNNHMGSLLTRHPGHMRWLMEILRARPGLYFVDSRTTDKTVAQQLADELGIPNTRRDVFLDDDPDPQAIEHQFDRLLQLARRQGTAIAIGHPHADTLRVLRRSLAAVAKTGEIDLLPLARIIAIQRANDTARQASWAEPGAGPRASSP